MTLWKPAQGHITQVTLHMNYGNISLVNHNAVMGQGVQRVDNVMLTYNMIQMSHVLFQWWSINLAIIVESAEGNERPLTPTWQHVSRPLCTSIVLSPWTIRLKSHVSAMRCNYVTRNSRDRPDHPELRKLRCSVHVLEQWWLIHPLG